MQNKLLLSIFISCLALSSGVTHAVSTGSLWGAVDEPVPPIQQIEKQQQDAQAEQLRIENQKTICELLTEQVSLDGDKANAVKISDALQKAYKSALPDYKMLLVGNDAANNLYSKYRDLYLSTYCLAGPPPTTPPAR